eukprot:gene11868-11664_t
MLPALPAKLSAGSRILAQVVAKVVANVAPSVTPTASGRLLAATVLVIAAAPAQAQLDYALRISAPAPLDALLEQNLDLQRFRDSPRMDLEQLQRLVRVAPEQIRTLVATEGYYSPEISATLERDGERPTVQIRVSPGEPVRVGEVELELQGFDNVAGLAPALQFDPAALKASWSLKQGAIFRQNDWEQAKRGLLRQVVQSRYPRAQIAESSATVDPDQHIALLRVVLDSGPELRFGALRVEGLQRYPLSVVANLNQIQPGDYYNEAALQAYQTRLQDSGYFSSVEVSADSSALLNEQLAAAEAPASRAASMAPLPLLVRVVENKQRNVSAGLGFSTNTGNRASLTYDDLSVFGLRMKSAMTLETKKQSAHSTLYFPTTAQGYNDSIGAAFERSDISGEVTSVASVAAKRSWGTPLLERNLSVELLTETKTLDGIPSSTSKSLPLTYGVTWRKLDNLLFPTK